MTEEWVRRAADRAEGVSPPAAEEPKSIEVPELPELTDKQEAFALGVLSGLSNREAYRAAYDASKMKISTVDNAASRLKADPKVSQYIRVSRMLGGTGSPVSTVEGYLSRLEELSGKAEADKDWKTTFNCVKEMGSVQGHSVQRSELTVRTPDMILAELVNADPTLAQHMAAKYSIPMPRVIEHEPAEG